ncbi:carboxymuconolactone decarboxylase family protein [Nocardia sp. BMG111209]|uniref:carboxymuconolactone decarboxylase family protein n=1 Tax=Nocardia sp. BMG111209 TaxID=1160137 RepID=UPI0003774A4A|nr:carboxymuconolactone decarboxylase family protein [Nocardia sp. BMG111209]
MRNTSGPGDFAARPRWRLTPLPAAQWTDRTREALRALIPRHRRTPEGSGTAMSTLVRHPDLTEAYLGFGVYLMFRSTLPDRIRELVVLRVAHRNACAYHWTHHLPQAAAAGISDAEVAGITAGTLADPFDQLLLDAVDELEENSCLSDRTWTALQQRLDEQQVMDLVFTVGGYVLAAMAYNTFGVVPENESTAR